MARPRTSKRFTITDKNTVGTETMALDLVNTAKSPKITKQKKKNPKQIRNCCG